MEPLLKDPGSPSRETMGRIWRVFVESLNLNLTGEDLSYEAKLDESVGLDSVAVLDFVTALEKEFRITFEPEMLNIDVVRDLKELAAYVDQQVARRQNIPDGQQ